MDIILSSSDDDSLTDAVTRLLTSMLKLPPHRSLQLTAMLVESVSNVAFHPLTQSDLVSSLLSLILVTTSPQSIVSMAISKQVTDWILAKVRSHEAFEVRVAPTQVGIIASVK